MKMVALLKGINVGGNRKVPMPKLIALAENSGLTNVRSYINSGNIVFQVSKTKPEQVGVKLEKEIEKNFGFKVDVIVRTASQWKKYSTGSPFPSAESIRPKMLHIGLAKASIKGNITQGLVEKALHGEEIKIVGDAIWVDFAKSVGKSKLTPAVFDKAAGSPVTMRNWNTVLKIWEMLN
jgi:uncharacterized protein (DUF1697 family)